MQRGYLIGGLILLAALAGCTPSSQTGTSYSREEARKVQSIKIGKVLDMQPVTIEGTKTGAGGVAGGAIGGIAGSGVGGGKGQDIMTVVGAVAGAAAGAMMEESITKKSAFEYTVRLSSGQVISVVQAEDPDSPIKIGDAVKLLSQGSTYRIAPLPNPDVIKTQAP